MSYVCQVVYDLRIFSKIHEHCIRRHILPGGDDCPGNHGGIYPGVRRLAARTGDGGGGSGSHLEVILDALEQKLLPGGRIVLNCITVQTLAQCLSYMRGKENYTYEAIQVQVNRLRQAGPYDMAEAINPIYIVTCQKNA